MDSIADPGPRQLARIAGALYLVNIVLGAFAISIVPAIVVAAGDVAATAHNIQAHELLYRLGLALNGTLLLALIAGLALTLSKRL